MNNPQLEWPDDIRSLLFDSEAIEIYHFIDRSSASTSDYADQMHEEGALDIKTRQQNLETIHTNMLVASEARYALGTIDNKIKRAQETNSSLDTSITQFERPETLSDFLYVIDEKNQFYYPPELIDSIKILLPDIHQSLYYRIHLSKCWEEIVHTYRDLQVRHITAVSSLITEISIRLQDRDRIKQVRDTLAHLEIQFTDTTGAISIPNDTEKIKEMLQKCVQTLETSQENINSLNRQQHSLAAVREDLIHKCEQIRPHITHAQSVPASPVSKKKIRTNMVYLDNPWRS